MSRISEASTYLENVHAPVAHPRNKFALDNTTEEAKAEEANESSNGKSSNTTDIIRQIQSAVEDLPELWLTGKGNIIDLLDDLFDISEVKARFKKGGFKTLFTSLLSYNATKYIFAFDTIVSLLAPNHILSKASNMMRNIALLDSMVGSTIGKISLSGNLRAGEDLKNLLKQFKDFPLNPNDFYIRQHGQIGMLFVFFAAISDCKVGDVIELKSPVFRNRPLPDGTSTDTLHCRIVYKSHELSHDPYGLYLKSATADKTIVLCELLELNRFIMLAPSLAGDRSDLTIRRLIMGTPDSVYAFYKSEDDFEGYRDTAILRALPMSTFDFQKNGIGLTSEGDIYKLDRTIFDTTVDEVYDTHALTVIERISNSIKLNCSRAFALVGIPGTGKTFLQKKIVRDHPESAVIRPYISDRGVNDSLIRSIGETVMAIPLRNILIVLDDFDKGVQGDENLTPQYKSQRLIEMFDTLHRACPGGFDKETGEPMRTFTLVATMNSPKLLDNSVIKRSERFDEVIEIGLPETFIYGKRLNAIKDPDDCTDFTSSRFKPVYWYMRRKVITLADLGNIYDILRIHRRKKGDKLRYNIRDLLYAVKYIGRNRASASKEYEL